MFDRLNDHDRIVHDQANGQHEAKKRECVDGKTQQREDREGPDERNGHGQHRNQRRPPPLKKDKDNQHDQRERRGERLDDFVDAFRDGMGGIQGEDIVEVRRKALLQLLHAPFDALLGLEGV